MARHVLCKTSDVPKGTCKPFKVNERGVALYNVDGVYYATQDFCRHKGGSLGKGELEGSVVKCPLHGWRYDVITGDCLTQTHCKQLERFEISVEGDEVIVEV